MKQDSTLVYYNRNATSFAQATQSVDFHKIQDLFLSKLKKMIRFWISAVDQAGMPSIFFSRDIRLWRQMVQKNFAG